MKRKVARTINVILWFALVITMMTMAYKTWSQYGDYTIFSFFASLVVHGGFGFIMGFFIDDVICRYFDQKEGL